MYTDFWEASSVTLKLYKSQLYPAQMPIRYLDVSPDVFAVGRMCGYPPEIFRSSQPGEGCDSRTHDEDPLAGAQTHYQDVEHLCDQDDEHCGPAELWHHNTEEGEAPARQERIVRLECRSWQAVDCPRTQ